MGAVGRCVYVSSKWACFPRQGSLCRCQGCMWPYKDGESHRWGPPPPPLFLFSPSVSNLNKAIFSIQSLSLFSRFFPCITVTILSVFFPRLILWLVSWCQFRAASIFASASSSPRLSSAGHWGWKRRKAYAGTDPVYAQEMLNYGTARAILSDAGTKVHTASLNSKTSLG